MNKPKQPLTVAQATNRAAALCSRSEQASGDIRKKLLLWGLNASDASSVLRDLTEQGFIDDARYARAFVNDRFAFNGWGKIKIAHQLHLKGISTGDIDQAMTVINDEQYRQRLIELLSAKWLSVQDREPRAAWAAMMRFAASRGFEADIARECIQQVTRQDVEDD